MDTGNRYLTMNIGRNKTDTIIPPSAVPAMLTTPIKRKKARLLNVTPEVFKLYGCNFLSLLLEINTRNSINKARIRPIKSIIKK